MRILLLNYEFPPVGGGAATASAQIALHLARRGAEVAVLTSHLKGLPPREQKDGYTIYRVPVMRRRPDYCSFTEMCAFIAGAVRPALRLASSFRPDVMHVFFGMPTGPVGLLVSRLKGVPYLLSLRGDDVPGRQEGVLALAHKLAGPLTRQVWSRAGALVVNGEGLRLRAERVLPGRKIELVPNGVDLEHFAPGERYARDGSPVRLLFVGRLHRQKGLSYLLQAISRLEPGVRERVELDLVGSGPDEGDLRSMVTGLGLEKLVHFSGWVSRDEIPGHYRRADIFAFPSFEEGMPNVVLEAMASGNAIVATDIHGVRGLVQDDVNGLLVPTADAEALKVSLQRLIVDASLRARLTQSGFSTVRQYDWSHVAGRYLALSEQLIGSPAPAVPPAFESEQMSTRTKG